MPLSQSQGMDVTEAMMTGHRSGGLNYHVLLGSLLPLTPPPLGGGLLLIRTRGTGVPTQRGHRSVPRGQTRGTGVPTQRRHRNVPRGISWNHVSSHKIY